MDTPTPSAPAAPAQPDVAPSPVVYATRAAADAGDFSAFEKAHVATLRGNPLPDVAPATPAPSDAPATPDPVDPPAAPTPSGEPTLSKRQQEINERTRRSVESATAQLREENARLKAQIEGRPAPRATEPPAAPTLDATIRQPDLSRPMLTEAEFFERHPEAPYSAYTRYAVHYDQVSASAAHQHQTQQQELTQAQHERVTGFVSRLDEAKAADPEFVEKLSPDVRALKPFGALMPGEAAGPANIIAEQVFDSPVAPQVLLHLSQHPEDLQRLSSMPAHLAKLPEAARVKAHIQWIVREFGKLESRFESAPASPTVPDPAPSPVSSAPPPPPKFGKTGSTADPVKAAVERGDFAAFNKQHVAQLRARRQG